MALVLQTQQRRNSDTHQDYPWFRIMDFHMSYRRERRILKVTLEGFRNKAQHDQMGGNRGPTAITEIIQDADIPQPLNRAQIQTHLLTLPQWSDAVGEADS